MNIKGNVIINGDVLEDGAHKVVIQNIGNVTYNEARKTSSNIQEQEPVAEDAAPAEQPTKAMLEESEFAKKYIVDQQKRSEIMNLLHQYYDKQNTPKLKLLPLRAAIEIGLVIGSISHKDYENEFGKISKTSFSNWIKKNKYNTSELESIYIVFEQF